MLQKRRFEKFLTALGVTAALSPIVAKDLPKHISKNTIVKKIEVPSEIKKRFGENTPFFFPEVQINIDAERKFDLGPIKFEGFGDKKIKFQNGASLDTQKILEILQLFPYSHHIKSVVFKEDFRSQQSQVVVLEHGGVHNKVKHKKYLGLIVKPDKTGKIISFQINFTKENTDKTTRDFLLKDLPHEIMGHMCFLLAMQKADETERTNIINDLEARLMADNRYPESYIKEISSQDKQLEQARRVLEYAAIIISKYVRMPIENESGVVRKEPTLLSEDVALCLKVFNLLGINETERLNLAKKLEEMRKSIQMKRDFSGSSPYIP